MIIVQNVIKTDMQILKKNTMKWEIHSVLLRRANLWPKQSLTHIPQPEPGLFVCPEEVWVCWSHSAAGVCLREAAWTLVNTSFWVHSAHFWFWKFLLQCQQLASSWYLLMLDACVPTLRGWECLGTFASVCLANWGKTFEQLFINLEVLVAVIFFFSWFRQSREKTSAPSHMYLTLSWWQN